VKIAMLVASVIGLGLASNVWAGQYEDLAAKGYRWVTVNGPYACSTEQELRQITNDHTDATELQMVEDGGAYYLIPGTLVQLVKDDRADGMSQVLLGGITEPLWTYTKFLSARPIRDTYGIVETPQISGLIEPGDAKMLEPPGTQPTSDPRTPITPQSAQTSAKAQSVVD
jgi:hypothetical protein